MGTEPIIIDSSPQLFIDDMLIEYSREVSLKINPPLKAGPVLLADRPWESYRIGAYGTIMKDGNICKMWYDAIDKNRNIHHCYAVSDDGVNWKKHNLNLVEYHGSKDNNILPLPPCGTVFIDPIAPPGQRYKYVTYGHGAEVGSIAQYGMRIWWSEDGLRWQSNENYALPLNADSQNQVFWDDRIRKYVAYLRAWNPLRCIARVEVEELLKPWPYKPREDIRYDPIHAKKWPAPTNELPIVFKYDHNDPNDSDHYNPCVVKYPFAKDVYYMFPSAYFHYPEPPIGKHPNDGRLEIQIATSRDGIHWNRLSRDTYVRLGRKNELDSEQMYMLVGMIRNGEELWMFHSGYNYTHGVYDLETTHYSGAIFRTEQRLDGFTSIDAGYKEGELLTKPMIFLGSKLLLNVDTSATGELKVQIEAEDGTPLKDFDLESCDTIHANDCSKAVSWNHVHDVSGLSGNSVRLRFLMRNTKLYAFQFS